MSTAGDFVIISGVVCCQLHRKGVNVLRRVSVRFFLLPRSLCVDALIELSDENADWKLSFDEFLNCLKPGFNPPEKSKP